MSGEVEQVEAAPVEEAAVESPAEESVVEREVESDTLEIPDSSQEGGKARYVPLSALDGARKEAKGLKAELEAAREGSAKAQQLEQRLAELEGHIQQIAPKAQAYDAALMAQRQPQPAVDEDEGEAIELAQSLDLYTKEGQYDIAKAKKMLAIMDKRAGQLAEAKVAPLAQHTVRNASNVMLARAKATKAPNGAAPDPAILDQIWSRLDPGLTATVEGAKQAWVAALGYSSSVGEKPRAADGKFVKQDIAPPLHTEKAGGKDGPPHTALDERDKKYIKDMGITEKDFLESASKAPWLRGR